MEAIPSISAAAVVAGPSSEVSTPAVHEEDTRYGHFAITASHVPKPTGSMSPVPFTYGVTPNLPAMSGPGQAQSPEISGKDLKSSGTRVYEDCHETDLTSPRLRSSRMFKGKGKEAVAVEREKRKPLRLLDLPVDILKDIVKEVTHTNDLTSLALCHSALHRLTTPHIYSRFDIVWPDSSTHAEPRSGVDALTYGLATLVMAEENFGEAPWQRKAQQQRRDQNNRFAPDGVGRATETQIRRRRGNHYAHFTRKFSLGNGPSDWVQEYLITKEGGKMLGTLVALAVARMRTLETFVWDMPTGILRDVWLALSSLGEREDDLPCKLEKVWVRWHDNSNTEATHPMPPPPPPIGVSAIPPPSLQAQNTQPQLAQHIHPAVLDRVEHPSFSILPPLKSLSVLDIDELAYLDEMAVLIGKSLDKLRELRVGIARHAITKDWVTVWEGQSLQQVDPDCPTAGYLTIGEKRLGGVMGILSGFVCDMRKPRVVLPDRTRHRRLSSRSEERTLPVELAAQHTPQQTSPEVFVSPEAAEMVREAIEGDEFEDSTLATEIATTLNIVSNGTSNMTSFRDVIPELAGSGANASLAYPETPSPADGLLPSDTSQQLEDGVALPHASTSTAFTKENDHEGPAGSSDEDAQTVPHDSLDDQPQYLDNALWLDSLELERVPISVPVLQKAIDWTRLTSLTLLHCPNHEQLWKTLRKTFAPTPKSPTYPTPRRLVNVSPRKSSKAAESEFEYGLNLKKVHTNTVSPALISFLKETLAPNSLETLFLQEARNYSSSVAIDAIFRGPLRRHRNSLRKVLIDSSEKGADGIPTNSSRWRRWMLNREILGFICSGKMPALKELGMAIDYRDWHFFLQHIPAIPHLRSLYLPFLADHVHGANVDPRELALQIVDIVALRPEVELCYMGIANKCFEILENRHESSLRTDSSLGIHPVPQDNTSDVDDDDVEDVEDEDEDDEDEDEAEEDTESEDDDEGSDDESEVDLMEGRNTVGRLRLREILFYDDKVAIFKARHGRL